MVTALFILSLGDLYELFIPHALAWDDMGAFPTQLVPLHLGEVLDHVRSDTLVATSGRATIYRATDLTSGQTVAIKVPHFEMESDPVFFDRFQREEAIGAGLSHPGVNKVLPQEDRSRLYMVLEWVEGSLLRQLLNETGKFPPARAVRIGVQMCEALEYIHTHGVVHRDLKPENIMVDADDHLRLIDFGIASKAGSRRLTFGKFSRTRGTPEYVSPEHVKGKRGDARSDVYSVGVMLYEMLTGETPFPSSDPLVALNAKLRTDPPSPREIVPELSPALEQIVLRALQRNPLHRYDNAGELLWDLEHQDQPAAAESARNRSLPRHSAAAKGRVLPYVLLGVIPVLILALLLFVAGRG